MGQAAGPPPIPQPPPEGAGHPGGTDDAAWEPPTANEESSFSRLELSHSGHGGTFPPKTRASKV